MSVPEEAVNAALEAVAGYWKGSRSALQQYPSRSLTRVMLEAAAPHIAVPKPSNAECDRLYRMLAEFDAALGAVRKALEMAAPLDDADREIVAAGWDGLRVLEGNEEDNRA